MAFADKAGRAMTSTDEPKLARDCDGCTLCCKLLGIGELQKPAGQWCAHCKIGEGCGIYEARPTECRTFNCAWLQDAAMPLEWAPKNSRMVVAMSKRGVVIHVDPSRAGAWRKPPFNVAVRRWAERVVPRGGQVLVREGREFFAILPGREKPLGKLGDDWVAVSMQRMSPLGA